MFQFVIGAFVGILITSIVFLFWYRHRSQHGWQWIAGFLAVFHFAIPFFILLFRKAKCYPVSLLVIALGFIPVHAVAVYWYVLPSFYPQQIAWHWFDIVVWLE